MALAYNAYLDPQRCSGRPPQTRQHHPQRCPLVQFHTRNRTDGVRCIQARQQAFQATKREKQARDILSRKSSAREAGDVTAST